MGFGSEAEKHAASRLMITWYQVPVPSARKYTRALATPSGSGTQADIRGNLPATRHDTGWCSMPLA